MSRIKGYIRGRKNYYPFREQHVQNDSAAHISYGAIGTAGSASRDKAVEARIKPLTNIQSQFRRCEALHSLHAKSVHDAVIAQRKRCSNVV